ncbi:hypothetical protein J6590_027649 [Homalodisca vitripennis]|nr:hypothetical protein J6590_027649 [Homalodisca vitripennis]
MASMQISDSLITTSPTLRGDRAHTDNYRPADQPYAWYSVQECQYCTVTESVTVLEQCDSSLTHGIKLHWARQLPGFTHSPNKN